MPIQAKVLRPQEIYNVFLFRWNHSEIEITSCHPCSEPLNFYLLVENREDKYNTSQVVAPTRLPGTILLCQDLIPACAWISAIWISSLFYSPKSLSLLLSSTCFLNKQHTPFLDAIINHIPGERGHLLTYAIKTKHSFFIFTKILTL